MALSDLAELQNGRHKSTAQSGPAPDKPEWLDEAKFNRGRQFFQDFLINCHLSMFVSLLAGLSVDNLLQALVFTDETSEPRKALKRYFLTFKHVCKWHYGNVWDRNSEAHKSIIAVRSMHNKVADDMNHENNSSHLFFSQYDMALVQCGFMGCIILYPESFGITAHKDYIDDYVYFWRCIGYLLGVDDQYNLCKDNSVDSKNRCRAIEQHVLLPALKNPPQDFRKMAQAIITGANIPFPFKLFTFESLLAFGLDIMQEPRASVGFVDILRLYFLKSFVVILKYLPFVRSLLNKNMEKNLECSKMT